MNERLSLYVHIPFCAKKCYYCDFLSGPDLPENIQKYTEGLCREIELRAKETEKKEKQEKEQKKSKNPFVYEQLSEMCPNLRSKDYKLYESNSPYTQYLKNIPEGSKVGGGAYFDGNNYYGRSYLFAPDAEDGNFIIKSNRNLIIGEFINVKITKVTAYDVEGEL